MKAKFVRTVCLPGLLVFALAGPAFGGGGVHVSITNLTTGTYFTPLFVASHDGHNSMFASGEPASSSLEIMAECGDISALVADMNSGGADTLVNPAGGLLAPGATATGTLMPSRHNRYLSLAAMLLPTNDGSSAWIPFPSRVHRAPISMTCTVTTRVLRSMTRSCSPKAAMPRHPGSLVTRRD